jgi:hypothetical protein
MRVIAARTWFAVLRPTGVDSVDGGEAASLVSSGFIAE